MRFDIYEGQMDFQDNLRHSRSLHSYDINDDVYYAMEPSRFYDVTAPYCGETCEDCRWRSMSTLSHTRGGRKTEDREAKRRFLPQTPSRPPKEFPLTNSTSEYFYPHSERGFPPHSTPRSPPNEASCSRSKSVRSTLDSWRVKNARNFENRHPRRQRAKSRSDATLGDVTTDVRRKSSDSSVPTIRRNRSDYEYVRPYLTIEHDFTAKRRTLPKIETVARFQRGIAAPSPAKFNTDLEASELPCYPKRRAEATCTDDDSVEENSPLGRRARSVRRPYNQHHRSRSSSCQRRSEFTDEDDDDLTDNRQPLSEEQFLLSRSTRSTSSGNFEPSRNLRSPLSSPDFTSMETNLDSYPTNDSLRPFYTTSHRHLYPQ